MCVFFMLEMVSTILTDEGPLRALCAVFRPDGKACYFSSGTQLTCVENLVESMTSRAESKAVAAPPTSRALRAGTRSGDVKDDAAQAPSIGAHYEEMLNQMQQGLLRKPVEGGTAQFKPLNVAQRSSSVQVQQTSRTE